VQMPPMLPTMKEPHEQLRPVWWKVTIKTGPGTGFIPEEPVS